MNGATSSSAVTTSLQPPSVDSNSASEHPTPSTSQVTDEVEEQESVSFERKKRKKVDSASNLMAKASAALEQLVNTQEESAQDLFWRYYSKRMSDLKHTNLQRKLKSELEELMLRYEEEDEELCRMENEFF